MSVQIDQIRRDFKQYTDEIEESPHDPENWTRRAEWYLEGYRDDKKNQWPFLAAADAFKVFNWFCDPKFRQKNGLYQIPDGDLRGMKFKACKVLVRALLHLDDVEEAKRYYDMQEFHLQDFRLASDETTRLNGSMGSCRPTMVTQRYPWIPSYFLNRDNFLHKIKQDLRCRGLDLRPSRIGPYSPDNLGVFAREQFEVGDILFREPVFRASSLDWKGWAITSLYDVAIKDLEKGTSRPLLSYPHISALTASYNESKVKFSLHSDIVDHFRYLEDKNPKLLWILDFDMWVLQTAQRRCKVNAFGFPTKDDEKDDWSVISPMTSLFQHSCEPSAVWRNENDGIDVMTVRADKVIEEGEEIYDSYCDVSKDLGERRKSLRHWIGCDCMCTRCVREEKEEAEKNARAADSGVEVTSSETSSSREASSSSDESADGDTPMRDVF